MKRSVPVLVIVAILFTFSAAIIPFPSASADPHPGCSRTCGSAYCADWSDGSWLCVTKTYCCGSGEVLTCDYDWGCDPNASTCMAGDAVLSGQIDPCDGM